MTHTPEPWIVLEFNGKDFAATVDTKIIPFWIDGNARRIVACVNACAGIDTVTLENFARGYPTAWDMVRELKQQNAELKEQSSRLAAEAVRQAQQNADLCVKNAELLNVIKWANNHGGLGYSIHGEFEKAIAKESK